MCVKVQTLTHLLNYFPPCKTTKLRDETQQNVCMRGTSRDRETDTDVRPLQKQPHIWSSCERQGEAAWGGIGESVKGDEVSHGIGLSGEASTHGAHSRLNPGPRGEWVAGPCRRPPGGRNEPRGPSAAREEAAISFTEATTVATINATLGCTGGTPVEFHASWPESVEKAFHAVRGLIFEDFDAAFHLWRKRHTVSFKEQAEKW